MFAHLQLRYLKKTYNINTTIKHCGIVLRYGWYFDYHKVTLTCPTGSIIIDHFTGDGHLTEANRIKAIRVFDVINNLLYECPADSSILFPLYLSWCMIYNRPFSLQTKTEYDSIHAAYQGILEYWPDMLTDEIIKAQACRKV